MASAPKDVSVKMFQDKEISDLSLDAFGHRELAAVLKDIVTKCPRPFSVGLFGRWGTGKSTIVEFLRKDLGTLPKVGVVCFNVWKFEGDSLRRAFLLNAEQELRLKGFLPTAFKIDKRVSEKVTEVVQSGLRFDKANLLNAGTYAVVAASILYGLVAFGISEPGKMAAAVGLGGIISLVLGVIQSLTKVFTVESHTVSHDRLSLPEEFEKEFDSLVQATTAESVVFIIDNLDRATHEQAVTLLTTVKTFLEKQKCIYLIPCDDAAIVEHLNRVYGNGRAGPFDGSEFLRKFFNAALKIPDFISSDLDHYTEGLIAESGLPVSSALSAVIATACRENPRKIKQFVNTLSAHYRLAQVREQAGHLAPAGTVTANPPFLAKILLLQQLWPEFYERIKHDPEALGEINASFRSVGVQIPQGLRDLLDGAKGLKEFLGATQAITAENIRAFIYFKQSVEETLIKDSYELGIALLDNRKDEVIQRLVPCQNEQELVPKYEKLIADLFKSNAARKERRFNILNSVAAAMLTHKIPFSADLMNEFALFLNNEKDLLGRLPPEFSFGIMVGCAPQYRKDLCGSFIGILGTTRESLAPKVPELDNFYEKLAAQMAEKLEWFKDQSPGIAKTIETNHTASVGLLYALSQNKSAADLLLTKATVVRVVENLTAVDLASEKDLPGKVHSKKLNVIFTCHDQLDNKVVDALFGKVNGFAQAERGQPGRPEKLATLDAITSLVLTFGPRVTTAGIANNISTEMNAAYAQAQPDARPSVITALAAMRKAIPEGMGIRSNIDSWLNPWFQSGPLALCQEILEHAHRFGVLDILTTTYAPTFNKRSVELAAFLDYLWDHYTDAQKVELLSYLTTSNSLPVLATKLEQCAFVVPEPEKVAAIMLGRAPSVGNLEQRGKLLELVIKLKGWRTPENLEKLCVQVKSLLQSDDQRFQDIGFKAFSLALKENCLTNEAHKKDIGLSVLSFLEGKTGLTKTCLPALESILLAWSALDGDGRQRYLRLLVFQWAVKTEALAEVEQALRIFKATGVKYEGQYQAHFQELRQRAYDVQDPAIRKCLKTALLESRNGVVNEDFWESVNAIPN